MQVLQEQKTCGAIVEEQKNRLRENHYFWKYPGLEWYAQRL